MNIRATLPSSMIFFSLSSQQQLQLSSHQHYTLTACIPARHSDHTRAHKHILYRAYSIDITMSFIITTYCKRKPVSGTHNAPSVNKDSVSTGDTNSTYNAPRAPIGTYPSFPAASSIPARTDTSPDSTASTDKVSPAPAADLTKEARDALFDRIEAARWKHMRSTFSRPSAKKIALVQECLEAEREFAAYCHEHAHVCVLFRWTAKHGERRVRRLEREIGWMEWCMEREEKRREKEAREIEELYARWMKMM